MGAGVGTVGGYGYSPGAGTGLGIGCSMGGSATGGWSGESRNSYRSPPAALRCDVDVETLPLQVHGDVTSIGRFSQSTVTR